jgi:transposase
MQLFHERAIPLTWPAEGLLKVEYKPILVSPQQDEQKAKRKAKKKEDAKAARKAKKAEKKK